MTRRNLAVCSIAAIGLAAFNAHAAEFPKFEAQTLDPDVGKVCYAVTLADVDSDGRQDVVAVTENRVLWYQAPDWKRRVIIEDQTERDNVCIAPLDIDGDGKVDFALGAGWSGKNTGQLVWLSRGASLDDKWHVHLIGHEPWTHRMRWAKVAERARPELVVSPLNKTQGDGVRLLAFSIPPNPKSDKWPSQVMNSSMNRMHNHWHLDWDDNGIDDTVTSSQEGIHLLTAGGFITGGGQLRVVDWSVKKLGNGATGDKPDAQGAGEIKVGKLKDGPRFIVTVEPMHGQACVVYVEPKAGEKTTDGLWPRHVIDATLNRGHALWTCDVDGDGSDEIVLGFSDPGPGPIKGPGVFIYKADDATGTKWTKHTIDDGGIATEDLICADLTGDGRIDIVAGGRATKNVKLYVQK
ncbi:MAG TPA: VCBS repeat-containing protein [Planctomycetaceae bacterium]|nr:VCBS repeat-containing protein [Planctomycetaceae bacterium]